MLGPFFFFKRTERPDRTGTNKVLFEWTPFSHQHAVVSWTCEKGCCSYWLGWRGSKFWMDPNTILYLGTERTAMNSLVPFRPVPQGRRELRHALRCPELWTSRSSPNSHQTPWKDAKLSERSQEFPKGREKSHKVARSPERSQAPSATGVTTKPLGQITLFPLKGAVEFLERLSDSRGVLWGMYHTHQGPKKHWRPGIPYPTRLYPNTT